MSGQAIVILIIACAVLFGGIIQALYYAMKKK